ncbi:SRPBCC family protein [Flavobacterium sp. FZUC8N2.13]|uniref:SRPBCC family protein n=1 Tax=Flavobacterium zubiriense TaxID=3138075 RepID=A0ABV4TCD0_9FLAO
MNLESPKVNLEKSADELFNLLTDMKNFEKLMPENIAKFEVIGDDSFLFGLKGMPEIQLKVNEKIAPNKIVFGSASDKVPFTLITNIESVSSNSSSVKLDFEGSFNPMMAMMVKGPISKFIETLVSNMPKL